MNSSSTYLSSHQAAENPSATCRLTGDDSIAHKESALYRKVRNLSSIHDGMPNLCRIPDGCGFVYTRMLRLSSFFCQNLNHAPNSLKKLVFLWLFCRSRPAAQQAPGRGRAPPFPPRGDGRGQTRVWTDRLMLSPPCGDGRGDKGMPPFPAAFHHPHGKRRGDGRSGRRAGRFSPPAREKERKRMGKGPRRTRERSPSPTAVMRCGPAGPNAPRPSRARCPSPPATARKAPGRRGGRPA